MHTYYWTDWYSGWGWFLWFAVWFLMISSLGNWGYTYHAHRRFSRLPQGKAVQILNERYARGDITRAEYQQLKAEIAT